MLELRSEKTIESTMRRVGNQIMGIFRDEPVEIFIPVFKRDLDVFEMKTGCYLFARSTQPGFQALLRLKSVTGVVCLVTEGESNRPSKAIKVEDSYVQGIIGDAENEFVNRAKDIKVNSFVRILNGEARDYCGLVEIINDGVAVIRVDLKTKSLLIETPIRNLLDLNHVPSKQRVFYYGSLVNDLVHVRGKEGEQLIAEDMHIADGQPPVEILDEPPNEEPKRHSRQRTVTAMVKRLVMVENQHDPIKIAKQVVEKLKSGDIKVPKNLFIVYCIIKDNLMKNYFKKNDPKLTNYREVIHKYGRQYKFSANDIAKIDPSLGIPVITTEVCKDGRSREARLKSKQKKLQLQLAAAAALKKGKKKGKKKR